LRPATRSHLRKWGESKNGREREGNWERGFGVADPFKKKQFRKGKKKKKQERIL